MLSRRPEALPPCLPPLPSPPLPAPLPSPPLQGVAGSFQVQQIAAALLGFLCYKAALVGVAIVPAPADPSGSQPLTPDARARRTDSE